MKNASEGYEIRQVSSQEDRWRNLQKIKGSNDLCVKDVLERVVYVATHQSEMHQYDHKCIDMLSKIIKSDHKFNEISIQSIMSEDDFSDIKDKYK